MPFELIMLAVFMQGRITFNEDGVKKSQFIIVDQYRNVSSKG